MIAYTTLALLVIALLGSVNIGIKRDRLFSFLVLVLFGCVFTRFYWDFTLGQENVLEFLWTSSPGGDIKIDIISNAYNYNLILPFFTITFIALVQNLLFRFEEKRTAYAAVLIFNLVTLITMITGNNFVQLLCALFVADILTLFLIKDMEAYRRYILLNISADMIIFTMMAIINCKADSLDIREILHYKQIGEHLDFIALAGLTASFMKMGLFIFHIGIIGLRNIRLHRLQNVLFLSSPIFGLVLLMKFHVLWNASPYFTPYLHVMCILSILSGFWGSLITQHFKAKIIYWQMMFWAILVELLCFKGFEWSVEYSRLLLQMYVLSVALYLIYYYLGRKNSLSALVSQTLTNWLPLNLAVSFVFLMFVGLSGTLTAVYNRGNRYYIWAFAVLYTASLATVLRQIFYTPKTLLAVKTAKLRTHTPIFFLLGLLSVLILQYQQLLELPVIGFALVFMLLCRFMPLSYVDCVLEKFKQCHNKDFVGLFYKYMVIKPLRLSGRFLWLLIDYLLVEKMIVGIAQSSVYKSLYWLRNLHRSTSLGGSVIVLIVAALICVSFIYGGYK